MTDTDRTLTDEQLDLELNEQWPRPYQTARYLAADRLGFADGQVEHDAIAREDRARAVAMWVDWLRAGARGSSPLGRLMNGKSVAEPSDDAIAFAIKWLGFDRAPALTDEQLGLELGDQEPRIGYTSEFIAAARVGLERRDPRVTVEHEDRVRAVALWFRYVRDRAAFDHRSPLDRLARGEAVPCAPTDQEREFAAWWLR
jgi:hypothetical protein